VLNTGIKLLAHFGIGVGIYFIQLLVLAGLAFIVGFLMIPSMAAYRSDNYDASSDHQSGFLSLTAVCGNTLLVNATIGCDNGDTLCEVSYRPQCELPSRVIVLDMIMSIVLVAAILSLKFVEKEVEETLDKAIQSSQDYSIVVKDPDPDAVDPDEWYKFFSRFGVVRYVTVTRKNAELGQMLLKRHMISSRIEELSESQSITSKILTSISYQYNPDYWRKKLFEIDQKLNSMYLKTYPACKVYVTFELESHKHLALNELEVPDYQAIFDIKSTSLNYRSLFRGDNVLNIAEPPEPDNILWSNLETKTWMKQLSRILGKILSIAFLIASYFIVTKARAISSTALSIVVVALDTILCIFFKYITRFGK
jgi:hypothetical protein